MQFLAVAILCTSTLLAAYTSAYTIVPGLAAISQPSCSYFTFYYNSAPELAQATSSFLSSYSFCATSTAAAPQPATTTAGCVLPTAAPDACVYPAGVPVGYVINGGFECISTPSWQFATQGNDPPTYQLVTASDCTNLPHSGAGMLELEFPNSISSIQISQAVGDDGNRLASVSFWIRADASSNASGCMVYLNTVPFAFEINPTSFLWPGTITSAWQQVSTEITGTGLESLQIEISGCTNAPTIYIDGATLVEVIDP